MKVLYAEQSYDDRQAHFRACTHYRKWLPMLSDQYRCGSTQTKRVDPVESDFFNCIAHERNADMMNDLFSLGDLITMVGSLRNAPDHSAEIVVQEVHISGGKQAAITGDTGMLS